MAILSIDLAHRRWSDLGLVVLDRERPQPLANLPVFAGRGAQCMPYPQVRLPFPSSAPALDPPIHCEILQWDGPGAGDGVDEPSELSATDPVDPEILAGRINHFCNIRNIRLVALDGPQAWKSRSNGLEHARVSERQLNIPTKTGLPGLVKPLRMRPYAEFCLDVYDALCRRGWRRMDVYDEPGKQPERLLIESSPLAAWRSLGIKPLPSKRRAKLIDLAEAFGALQALIPLSTNRPPNHDQIQAIVAGLPGLALDERNPAGVRIVGYPPRREEGHWREGYIVLPVAPTRPNVRWLH